MSKFSMLWDYISKSDESRLILSFEEIAGISGVPIDHSFLKYKKELEEFGWRVGKISMKQSTVSFEKNAD